MIDLAPQLPAPPTSSRGVHLNPPEQLAPVGLWLLVELPGGELGHARRTGYVESKGREMTYELRSGEVITGKLRWTYP